MIKDHKWFDHEISLTSHDGTHASQETIALEFSVMTKSIWINKDDAIALARHFKLIDTNKD